MLRILERRAEALDVSDEVAQRALFEVVGGARRQELLVPGLPALVLGRPAHREHVERIFVSEEGGQRAVPERLQQGGRRQLLQQLHAAGAAEHEPLREVGRAMRQNVRQDTVQPLCRAQI